MTKHLFATSSPKPVGQQNQKVKIYFLTRLETWVDLGIGSLFQLSEFNPDTEESEDYLQVQAASDADINESNEIEEDEVKKLNRDLEHRIIIRFRFDPDNSYEKQNESIIICKEKESGLEVAISFTDVNSAEEFWDFIKKNNGANLIDSSSRINSEQYENLQMPFYNKLEETLEAIDSDLNHFSQGIVYKPEFLDKLFNTFDELESIQDFQKLQLIHLIVKKLVFSNEQKLIAMLLSDKYYYACLGSFEYKRGGQKENYREEQKKEERFKQVVEIKEIDILEKIHLNYRLQYLKDVVLASCIEDSTINSFNLMIIRNNIEIINFIKESTFLHELAEKFFVNLSSSVKLIGEIFNISNNPNFAMQLKPQLVETMNSFGFQRIFFDALVSLNEISDDKDLRTKQILKILEGITILSNECKRELISLLFTGQSGEQISEAAKNLKPLTELSDTEKFKYIKVLSVLLQKEETGAQVQILEIFKVAFELLKINNIEDTHVLILIEQLWMPCLDYYDSLEESNQYISFVVQFLEILSLAYRLAPNKFRPFVIKREIIPRLFKAAESKSKSIHLSLVKFIRQIILSDSPILHHLIQAKVIDTLWGIYRKHQRRSNIINSTFQDMMLNLLVLNCFHMPKLFKYIMSQFGEEVRAKAGKSIFLTKILEVYGEKKSWINQDRNEHLEFQNSDLLQEPHPLMESIEEEKYFDTDDKIIPETHEDVLQEEKLKETELKKQSLSNKIFKKHDNDDEEEGQDIFQLLPDDLNNNNTKNIPTEQEKEDPNCENKYSNTVNGITHSNNNHNQSNVSSESKDTKSQGIQFIFSDDLGHSEDGPDKENKIFEEENIFLGDLAAHEPAIKKVLHSNLDDANVKNSHSQEQEKEVNNQNAKLDIENTFKCNVLSAIHLGELSQQQEIVCSNTKNHEGSFQDSHQNIQEKDGGNKTQLITTCNNEESLENCLNINHISQCNDDIKEQINQEGMQKTLKDENGECLTEIDANGHVQEDGNKDQDQKEQGTDNNNNNTINPTTDKRNYIDENTHRNTINHININIDDTKIQDNHQQKQAEQVEITSEINKKRTLREREGNEDINNINGDKDELLENQEYNNSQNACMEESRFRNTNNLDRTSGEELLQKKIKVD